MTSNNSPLYTPFEHTPAEPNSGLFTEESWLNFLDFTSTNRGNNHPTEDFEEIMFNKPQEPNFGMEIEVEGMPFDRESYYKSFADDIDQDSFDFMSSRENRSKIQDNIEEPVFFDFIQEQVPEQQVDQVQVVPTARETEPMVERSECSQCHSDEEEIDTSSVSTNHSYFNYTTTNAENDALSTTNIEEAIFADQPEDFESDFKEKILSFMSTRNEEERQYIEKVTPMLINSIKEVQTNKSSTSLSVEIVAGILKELLYKKEAMIVDERKHLNSMVEEDMKDVRGSRMDVKIKEEDVMSTYKRKVAPGVKGKKNRSSLNHINENYVSNIFQFAKRNYLEDKELQRIGNERNVSALNFRKLMAVKMTDDITTRKAKVRIIGAGRELLSNVEAYMTEGYFEQCADREKYIWHKEKALRDLALTGQH